MSASGTRAARLMLDRLWSTRASVAPFARGALPELGDGRINGAPSQRLHAEAAPPGRLANVNSSAPAPMLSTDHNSNRRDRTF
jgi:hypothetical protein